jgi:hypothetical protein
MSNLDPHTLRELRQIADAVRDLQQSIPSLARRLQAVIDKLERDPSDCRTGERSQHPDTRDCS